MMRLSKLQFVTALLVVLLLVTVGFVLAVDPVQDNAFVRSGMEKMLDGAKMMMSANALTGEQMLSDGEIMMKSQGEMMTTRSTFDEKRRKIEESKKMMSEGKLLMTRARKMMEEGMEKIQTGYDNATRLSR
ncbi:hypothetical protein [Fundidesulfovibrio putealis]|uniref:hypothetical protein n=1 Tax=Fundidesulfovibrio putealis TaxID=270496 RepID=UPI000483D820|nr:hypothetical protein [Fundidesulfovibrio putealis]